MLCNIIYASNLEYRVIRAELPRILARDLTSVLVIPNYSVVGDCSQLPEHHDEVDRYPVKHVMATME